MFHPRILYKSRGNGSAPAQSGGSNGGTAPAAGAGQGPLQILAAGFVAGAVSRTSTAPMDRLRSLMAAGGTSTLGKEGGTSILSGLRAMYAAGGLRCMWQGNMANVIQVGPESALLFFINDALKATLLGADGGTLSVTDKFLCGATAGMISMSLVYPMYVVQNRMMVASEGLYSGVADCVAQTYRHEGAKAFVQGFQPSLVRIIPYKGIDLTGYHILRELCVPEGEAPTTLQSLAFGATASCVSQTVTHPLLLARTKLQCQGDAMGRPVKYHSMWDAIAQTYARGAAAAAETESSAATSRARAVAGGLRMLWSGWGPSMAKNVPAIAIQFAIYERALEAISACC